MKKKGVTPKGVAPGAGSQDDDSAFGISPLDRAALQQIKGQREALQAKIDEIDDRIFALETTYLRSAADIGSLFDGYGTSSAASVRLTTNISASMKRRGTFPETDRIFSISSGTSLSSIRKRMRDLEASSS